MAVLKELKKRIESVKSTSKITKAMKMVAASKLRKASLNLEKAKNYNNSLNITLDKILPKINVNTANSLNLFARKANVTKHLYILAGSDRGLCGGFNSNIYRFFEKNSAKYDKNYAIICLHNKIYNILKRDHKDHIIEFTQNIFSKNIDYQQIKNISEKIIHYIDSGEFGSCSIIYNKFCSTISQIVTEYSLIPFPKNNPQKEIYNLEYEPNDEIVILTYLLKARIASQIYYIMLENMVSEHAARMNAMDGATRNANKMIKDLTIQYNRSRQANITKELIEIIAGAEAL